MKYALLTISILFLAIAANAQECKSIAGLPDRSPNCTPGEVRTTDINVICHPIAAGVRPSYYTGLAMKRLVMKKYGVTNYHAVVSDHLVSLSNGGAGGSIADLRNVWVQTVAEAKLKDIAERKIHSQICHGQITVANGQAALAGNWRGIK